MKTSLVLINPWIYDFAAYDLWSKPLGLLYIGAYLRDCGFDIHLIDCLNVHHPMMPGTTSQRQPKRGLYGTGKFWRNKVPKPLLLKDIPRPYSRYGISPEAFTAELNIAGRPGAFLVTSLMTYWHLGVKEVIRLVRQNYPDVPVILGGIYARLCQDHAVTSSGADYVIADNNALLSLLDNIGLSAPNPIPKATPYPAFDLLSRIDYICILTSRGCPYRCSYCASHFLEPAYSRRDPLEVVEEILFWHRHYGVKDFAFYDDALLVQSDTHAAKLFEEIAKQALGIRFHTPNALHVREISPGIAILMHRSGFNTIRLGFETADFSLHHDLDNKVQTGDFEMAVNNLLNAGFARKDIGAYLLAGLPGQSVDSVVKTIDFVRRVGVMPYLAEYSPIPHTALWDKAVESSRYDLTGEPLFHNNTLIPCWDDSQKKEFPKLKQLVLEARMGVTAC
ncbi:Radical SAM domain protein [uncultured Desulfobacterium sp.]|uniref:Radical SAM domain protein n=1 Tax=uncultured Desulfobacterium sp. TaxID=201089 RepID=A0A445MX18_9BACT|nr:Radical SAM domain protein [uncultured Desulfobacterium sp.]